MDDLFDEVNEEEAHAKHQFRYGDAIAHLRHGAVPLQVFESLSDFGLQVDESGEQQDSTPETKRTGTSKQHFCERNNYLLGNDEHIMQQLLDRPVRHIHHPALTDPASSVGSPTTAKATAMAVLFVASFVMGNLPVKLGQWLHWGADAKDNVYVKFLLGMGGGVLLCTTFLHLLPEVGENFDELDLTPGVEVHYAELLMCIGFFVMYLVEECVHVYLQMKEKSQEMAVLRRSLSIRRGVSIDVNRIEEDEEKPAKLFGYSEGPRPSQHSHQAGHSHLVFGTSSTVTIVRGLLVVLALSVHELFEGLAVGLESSPAAVWYMFGAVSAHKLVIAFCIGVELVTSGLKTSLVILYVFTFAVVSPLGIDIDLEVFLTFNKIKRLNCTPDDIRKAISKSELVELSDDKEKVRRKIPLKVKENVEECTIYVENIKTDANHDWITQLFSDFGKVVYVSIPKYKNSKGNKGFAFVEFDSEKDAQNALSFFEKIGCKMPSETSPEELKSIKTFDETMAGIDSLEKTNKRKLTDEDDELHKKLKTEDNESNIEKSSIAIDNVVVDQDNVEKTVQNEVIETEDMENRKKKKHKRDKKKNYIKELGLQVLSKQEWKKMRNRYLDLQRKKMKEFKTHLNRQRFSQKNYDRQKLNKEDSSQPSDETPKEDVAKLEFVPGVIIKMILNEPYMDSKKLKNDIKSFSAEVKFVDIPLPSDSNEVFVRFSTHESAREFCSKEFMGEKSILEGEEESLYWEKVQNDRSVKFAKNVKKQRGRDKLLKKAEKERANHIKFEEGEN
ncbi:unnamed protein product [Phaedon cochleariae]|uniref:La-related protein 7 n=1 Tax=Phaedon cochleariae TaxID=80249 RepID=A0A9N9X7J9_PHACE|nr:unnamed protein product [Phaedon cochleariae]